MRAVDRLRLGRAALPQEDAEDYHAADGEKLTLPILHRFEPEPLARQVAAEAHRRLTVEQLFFIVVSAAAQAVEEEGDEKQEEKPARANFRREAERTHRASLATAHAFCS